MEFVKFDPSEAEWSAILEQFADRELHQTAAWLQFIAEAQSAKPVHAVLRDGGRTYGYFSGLIVSKLGFKILGSPFAGWTTSYMGFNLVDDFARGRALDALCEFAFRKMKCHHLEIMDRGVTVEDGAASGFDWRMHSGFEVDLQASEEEIFGRMTSACRRCIRKAQKGGVVIEQASDPGFVDDFYAQLQDVFAKQGVFPTYAIERVRLLYRHVFPTGGLLLLRARDTEGRCIATGIFPAWNETMYFWGGASWREHQIHRPNELLMWHAMLYWKDRGVNRFDMGGSGEYKRKYGGREIAVPWLRKSKFVWIMAARKKAERLHYHLERIKGRRARLS